MGHSGNIQAVTFDVGGTLIEPWPSVGHVYAEVAARHGAGPLEPDLLNRRFEAAWKAHPGFDYAVEDWSEIVDATFADLITDKPSRTFFHELYERFAQAGAWRIYDDVLPALTALTECQSRLGVVSNWDDRLRPLLTSLGLAGHLSIIVSWKSARANPRPLRSEAAVKHSDVPPDRICTWATVSRWISAPAPPDCGRFKLCAIRRADSGQLKSLRELTALVCARRDGR
jgi:FMN phosphatase YigB (HAD superfamily)